MKFAAKHRLVGLIYIIDELMAAVAILEPY